MSRIITIFARKLFKMTDELIEIIIEGLQDSKARDIRVIDMRQLDEAAFMSKRSLVSIAKASWDCRTDNG